MPIINRPLIGLNNDDEHYEALVKRKVNNNMNHDTPKKYASIPIVSIVVVHRRWWRMDPWDNRRKGNHNHNDRSYTIQVTKTGQLITRNSKHVKPTLITAKQYLCDQLDKHIVTDPLEDILKHLAKQTHTNHTFTRNEQLKNIQN